MAIYPSAHYDKTLQKITNCKGFLIGVVDDDPTILESLEELLGAGGYKSSTFASVDAFLEADGFRRVVCLISDLVMPTKTGWELLEIARTKHPGFPVILITARYEEAASAFPAKGAVYLLRKPFDGRELLRVLDNILANDPTEDLA